MAPMKTTLFVAFILAVFALASAAVSVSDESPKVAVRAGQEAPAQRTYDYDGYGKGKKGKGKKGKGKKGKGGGYDYGKKGYY
jgi:hypothetical protein